MDSHSDVKVKKKVKGNYGFYVPPPARRVDSSPQTTNKQDSDNSSSTKVKDIQKKSTKRRTKKDSNPPESPGDKPSSSSNRVSDSDLVSSFKENCQVLDVVEINDIRNSEPSTSDSDCENKKCEFVCKKFNTVGITLKSDGNHNFNVLDIESDIVVGNLVEGTQNNSDLIANGRVNKTQSPTKNNKIFQDVWEKLLIDYKTRDKTVSEIPVKNQDECKRIKSGALLEINESCILEIYNFPAEYKTRDLLSIFSVYVNRGFQLRWVDDTHALGIFPSEVMAYEVLNTDLPRVLTRSLNRATAQSKDKAIQIMPPPLPPRPKTCIASARRMVSGALGIRAVFTREEIQKEKEMLKEARDKKAAKHK